MLNINLKSNSFHIYLLKSMSLSLNVLNQLQVIFLLTAVRKKNLSFLILILWNLYLAVTFVECRVSSSYFFLFFGLPPIFSYFFFP